MISPLISVIIPVYRVEPYLCFCIDSVLAQTYQNTEIILVDDGSPDRCPEICDAYAAEHRNVSVIHKENGGISSARNAGIDIASGEYIAFLDSDDYYSPVFLERLFDALKKTGADISVCRSERVITSQLPTVPVSTLPHVFTRYQAFECFFTEKNPDMVVAWNKLYPSSFFHSVRYPNGRIHEDEAVIHELIGQARAIAWLDEKLYYYRDTENSITTSSFTLKRLDELYAKECRIAYFKKHEMWDLYNASRLVYASIIMRNYRLVRYNIKELKERNEICSELYHEFLRNLNSEVIRRARNKSKIRYLLFAAFPHFVAKIEYRRYEGKSL